MMSKRMAQNISVVFLTLLMLVQTFIPNTVSAESTAFRHENGIVMGECTRSIEGEIRFKTPEKKKNIDLVIVQDASGSFERTIGQMKEALKSLVGILHPDDQVMLVTYRGGNDVVYQYHGGWYENRYYNWPYLRTETNHALSKNHAAAKNAIDRIYIGGATPTASGLNHAFQSYEQSPNKNEEAIFLLVTDGVANVREDGKIWLNNRHPNNGFHEGYQDYETATEDALKQAKVIKSKDYHFVSTFIEDKHLLSANHQYGREYTRTVGPYVQDKLREMATSEDYYQRFDHPDAFKENMTSLIADLREKLTSSKLVVEIEEGYEVKEAKLYKGDELVNDALDLKSGVNEIFVENNGSSEDYRLEYKLKETDVHKEDRTPVKAIFVSDEDEKHYQNPVIEANESEVCTIDPVKPKKTVNDDIHYDLDFLEEIFEYEVEVEFGHLYGLEKMVIEDEVDELLTILEESIQVEVEAEKLSGQITVQDNRLQFVMTEDFESIQNKTVVLRFKAQVRDDVTYEKVMERYETGLIPNEASVFLDDRPSTSNEVTVKLPEPISLTVEKEWVGGPSDKPEVEIVLKQNTEVIDTIHLNEESGWSYTWHQLPEKDANGEKYRYSVDEVNVPENYEKEVDGFKIVNHYVPAKKEITVQKNWVNGPKTRPSVDLVLYRDGKVYREVSIGAEDDWTYTWTDLDETDVNGNPFIYTVDEVNVPENYQKEVDGLVITNEYVIPKTEVTVEKEWIGGPSEKPAVEIVLYRDDTLIEKVRLDGSEGWQHTWTDLDKTDANGVDYVYTVDEVNVPENYEKEVDGHQIINRYVSPKTEVSVQKNWVHGPKSKPAVDIVLKQNDEELETVRLDGSEGWQHTWTDLDKTDANGVDYVYTVDEVNVPNNYEKEVNGHQITNTYVSPKTELTVEKEWVNGPEEKPAVEIVLYRDGEELDTVTLDGSEDWTYTWTDLDQTDKHGKDYVYTVDEVNVPENYEKEVDGHTIRNSYVSPKTELTVEKEWVNGPEEKPAVEIILKRNGENFDTVILDGSENWTYTWTDLDKTDQHGVDYEYTVDEVNVPTNYVKEIDGNTITNRYVSPKTDITVEKHWKGGPKDKPAIVVGLYRDTELFKKVELDGSKGWTYTWTDLDLTDEKGRVYDYTVDEIDVPENYEKEVDGLTLINHYVPPKTAVTVEKQWLGGPAERPTVDLVLYRDGVKYREIKLDGTEEWSHTWEDLDATDEKGVPYEYTVDEINVPENYEKEIKGLTVYNHYVSPKTEVTVEKEWVNGPEEKPEIEVVLYRDRDVHETVKLNESNDWTHTWTDLDLTDHEGNPYQYRVDELNVPENYEKEVDGHTIRNTYVSPKTEVSVEKEWSGGPDKKSAVEIVLYRNGEEFKKVTLDGSEDWTHTWTDLDQTDKHGKDYVYTVDEVNVPENYEKEVDGHTIRNTYVSPKTEVTVEKEWINGPEEKPAVEIVLYRDGEELDTVTLDGSEDWTYTWTDLDQTNEKGVPFIYTVDEVNVPENYEKEVDGHTIRNTYVSPKTEVTVEKEWVNGPEEKPAVEIVLYRDGEEFKKVTLDGSEDWTHTWTDLDQTDKHGKDYVYTVDEVNVPENYEKEVDGHTIHNTYVSPKTEVTVEKEWINGPEEKPAVEIVLYRDGEEFKKVTLDGSEDWTHTWTDLDQTDKHGKDYVYTVDEVNVPENYEKEVDGHTIRNSYVSPKTEVTVEKEWINGPEEKPAVEIVLYRDGEEFKKVTLDGSEDWTHTWTDLDQTDKHGKEYVYTVDEVNVPENYEKAVDGHTIRNSYVSPKTEVTVEKEWINGPEEKPAVEIVLYRDGEEFKKVTLDGSEDWTHTWTDLDQTDKHGKEYVYTVDEVNVPENYVKELKGFTIINRFEDVEEVKEASIEPKEPLKTVVKTGSSSLSMVSNVPVLPSTGMANNTWISFVLILIGWVFYRREED